MSKQRFRMSDADLEGLYSACKPVPYMVFCGVPPRSQRENAEAYWGDLGRRMGFVGMTAEPCGNDDHDFMAVPAGPQRESLVVDPAALAAENY